MQSHHGLHGTGNSNTNSHQAQLGRLRFPIFSDSIQFTSIYVQSIPETYRLTHYRLTFDNYRVYEDLICRPKGASDIFRAIFFV
jgi:hypothetical protein